MLHKRECLFWIWLLILIVVNVIPLGNKVNSGFSGANVWKFRLDYMIHLAMMLVFYWIWVLGKKENLNWFANNETLKYCVVVVSAGISLELLQLLLPWRTFNPMDLLYNLIGAALAVTFVLTGKRSGKGDDSGLAKSAKGCASKLTRQYYIDIRDFSLEAYSCLLSALKESERRFHTLYAYLNEPASRAVILRHDVDKMPRNSLAFARIEHDMGIKASYYFRIVPQSFQPEIIKKIADLGHEIGYHYEDMDLCKGHVDKAYEFFQTNLARLRAVVPVTTICMHGSPLSKWDNRELWKKYDYRELGIIGEPYFDIDYSKVFYLTDTGRKWNSADTSIRDKVDSSFRIEIKNTNHLIQLIKEGRLPDQIMINTHPQRWNDNVLLWGRELVWQALKNQVKKRVVKW